ncbi:NADH-quinone oxidoreductase subunit M [Bacillus sp. PS06]|uniref:NADH-quinone oxidoreductase subunit M n=1 Tax=Bacillus sp. PS06 TaxID=2764176 RepID=UPI0017807A20|nr:NADH-quinone oxidoreductase subunit M [Bacillus sp. PS06]MBD8069487.1 NADH-quinone oxidoreductase subunit M [Bacillus sp. PS06]
MNESYILSLLVFSPIIGIVLLAFIPKAQEQTLKLVGFLSTLPALVLAFVLYSYYRGGTDLTSFSEKIGWFGILGKGQPFSVDYELGINGFSLVMVLLTAVLSTLAAIASIHIKKEWKGYFILFLFLEIGMLGVFLAENLVLFFLFFEITLVTMFFLIGKWGYFEKEKAAFRFLIYNGIGSAILLIVIMVIFAKTGTTNIHAITSMMASPSGALPTGDLSSGLKYGLLIALLIAFGIKLPIFPLHTWMLHVHVQAPPSIVMLHSGVLLKIGAFGFIRFGVGFFPEEFSNMAWLIALLGVINLLYGAFLAFIQTDFKMVLAYSSISHMGIVLIGLGSLNEAGIQGAIFQVVSHGLISALLFFLIGVLYERVGTSQIDKLGGLAKVMPLTSGFLLAGAMASLGLPGMSGFVSEFMAFLGLFKTMPVLAAVGAIGIIMTAVYLLRAVLNVTYGKTSPTYEKVYDITKIELVPVLILLGLIVLIGVYPNVLSEPLQLVLENIVQGTRG